MSYAGLADFFSDVSYQAEDAWLEEISKSSEERWHKDQCREYLLPDVPGKAHLILRSKINRFYKVETGNVKAVPSKNAL